MRGIAEYTNQFTRAKSAKNYVPIEDVEMFLGDLFINGVVSNAKRSDIAGNALEQAIKEVDIAIFAAQANSRSPDVPKD